MSLFIKKKTLKKAVSTLTAITTMVWLSGVSMLAVSPTMLIADERPSVVVDDVTVYDGDLISSNATNPDETPTYASLDIYIAKVVGAKKFKRLVLNPEVFNSYGHLNWEDVREVNQSVVDAFTTSSLVRVDMAVDASGKVYALASSDDAGSKSWIDLTASEFTGVSGTDADAIYTINSVDAGNYTAVTEISTTTQLETFYSTGELPGVTPVPAGALAVALSANTPATATLPLSASGVELMRFNLTAGEATTIDSITIHRFGVGATTTLSNVYLYEGATRLTSGRSVGSSTNNVEFASLNISLTAGQAKTLSVKVDVAASGTGDIHGFEIESASSITGPGSINGSFPVRGNVMSIGTQAVSTVTVTKGTTPPNPTIGEAGATLSEFKLQAGSNDVKVQNITLIHSGTTSSGNISGLELYAGSELVASASAMTGDKMVFVLDSPYTIAQGITRVFQVKGALAGRSGLTVKTYAEYAADVLAIDATHNVGAKIDIGTSGTFDGSATGTKYIEITSQGGRVTVAFNGPATADVSKGSQDVTFYKFAMTANEQQVEVKKIGMTIAKEATGDGKVKGATNNTFTDLKIIDTDTGKTLMGPKEYSVLAAATTTGEVLFTDTFYINAGQTRNLALTADIRNTEDASGDFIDDAFAATLSAFTDTSIREVASGQYLVAATDIVPYAANTGNNQTVRTSSLTVALASTPVSSTIVKKAENVESLGLSFAAGSQSSAKISAIILTGVGDLDNAASYTVGEFDDIVLSVSLWDDKTPVGVAKSPTTAGVLSFTNLNWTVLAGATKKLTAKANITSTSGVDNNDYYYLTLNSTDVTATDKDGNTITLTAATNVNGDVDGSPAPTVAKKVISAGTLSAKVEGSPSAAIVVAGNTAVTMAKYKLNALYEAFTIEKLEVASDTNSAFNDAAESTYDRDLVRVGIKSGETTTWSTVSAGVAKFSALNISVPADGSVYVEIVADLNTIAGGAVSGDAPRLGINSYQNAANTFRAVGVGSSTVKIYDTLSSVSGESDVKAMALRKTAPTVVKASGMSSTLTNGTINLYGFTVVADSASAVSMKQLRIAISGVLDDGDTLSQLKFYRSSTDLSDDVSIYTSAGGNAESTTDIAGASVADELTITFDSSVNKEEVVPAGSTYTYYLKAQFSGASTGNSLSAYIADDTAAPASDFKVNNAYLTAAKVIAKAASGDTYIVANGDSSAVAAANIRLNAVDKYTVDNVTATTTTAGLTKNATQPISGAYGVTATTVITLAGTASALNENKISAATFTTASGDTGLTCTPYTGTNGAGDIVVGTTLFSAVKSIVCTGTNRSLKLLDMTLVDGTSPTSGVAVTLSATLTKATDYSIDTAVATGDSDVSIAVAATDMFDCIWSDNSATSHSTTTADWTNGYLVNDLATDTHTLSY